MKYFFIVLTLTCIILLLTPNHVHSQSNDLDNLTQDLTSPNISLARKIQIATKRKTLLVKLAQESPLQFLNYALPSDQLSSLPPELQELTEHYISGEGKLVTTIGDNFEQGTSTTDTTVSFDSNYFLLASPTKTNSIPPNTTLNLKGYTLDSYFIPTLKSEADLLAAQPAPLLPTTGEQNLLALLVGFADKTGTALTPSVVEDNLFNANNPASLTSYYKENSYNQTYYTGMATNWLTIGNSQEYLEFPSCMFKIAYDADQKAKQIGIDINQYTRRILFLSDTTCLQAGGRGTLSDNPSITWVGSYINLKTIYHELGHNFNLHHASSLSCNNKSIDAYDNCYFSEYGDSLDIMGSTTESHFQGAYKYKVGWIPKETLQNVNTSRTYTLYNLHYQAPSSTVPKLLVVRKPDTNEYYTISYRNPPEEYLHETSVDTYHRNGALIRIGHPQKHEDSPIKFQIINSHPLTYEHSRRALKDGAVFDDQINGIQITQVSHTPDTVTLQITQDDTVCNQAPPTIEVTPDSIDVNPSQTVTHQVTVKNHDSAACSPKTYELSTYISGYLGQTWVTTLTPNIITLDPGQSASISLEVQVPSTTPLSEYPYYGGVAIQTDPPVFSNVFQYTLNIHYGDANNDGQVNLSDSSCIIQTIWSSSSTQCPYPEMIQDGNINLLDFNWLLHTLGY